MAEEVLTWCGDGSNDIGERNERSAVVLRLGPGPRSISNQSRRWIFPRTYEPADGYAESHPSSDKTKVVVKDWRGRLVRDDSCGRESNLTTIKSTTPFIAPRPRLIKVKCHLRSFTLQCRGFFTGYWGSMTPYRSLERS